MNQFPGIIGRKLGMTQVFTEEGSVIPCTVVESEAVVIGKRTQDKDGYTALILGQGERKEKHTPKPLAGYFKKVNTPARRSIRELRCEAEFAAKFEVGQPLKVGDVFKEGQFVDVQGITRGRGFTGVVRRHNFAGNVQTHGTHEYRRHGGSIGCRITPGRTFKGLRMPGQYGNETLSVLNQRVVKVLPDQNVILIGGGIPGARDGAVVVRGAIKLKGGIVAPVEAKPEKAGKKK